MQRIQINNFQSHKNTNIDLHPGVNVIVGSSDSGKTAIIRALRWVMWNRPLGNAFRSSWGGDTSVTLDLGNRVIERSKGKKDRYRIDNEQHTAFGSEVPKEVSEALNLNEINLQSQLDSPFLVSNNPGEVARHFNRIANIDTIDSSLKNIESWIRDINHHTRYNEKEIDRLQDDLEKYRYLEKMEVDVESLEKKEKQTQETRRKKKQISEIISELKDIDNEIGSYTKLTKASKPISHVLTRIEEKETRQHKFQKLQGIVRTLKGVNKDLKEHQDLVKAENSISRVLELYNKKERQTKYHKKLKKLIDDLNDLNEQIASYNEKLKKYETTWHKKFPSECPLCGQPQS